LGIAKNGQWYVGDNVLSNFKSGNLQELKTVVFPPDPETPLLVKYPNETETVYTIMDKLDVIFPIIHGTFGEDGSIQGLLELANLPYVGSGVLGSSVTMDKIIQKQLCRQMNLPVVDYMWLRKSDWILDGAMEKIPVLPDQLANHSQKDTLKTIIKKLELPLFVKPANLGSSVGISKARDASELEDAIHTAFCFDRRVIVEKAVENVREIEIGVLGNEYPRSSIAGEVIPSNEFYDYDAKYIDDRSELIIPANIPEDMANSMQEDAIKAFSLLDTNGMARIDFLVDSIKNQYYLSEINTIPGFTKISMYPKLWENTGISYTNLLDELIHLALERCQTNKNLHRGYQPKSNWYE
jgi:D-alanine-D-alanine ligase